MSTCFICENELEDGSVLTEVKQKGLETFRQASNTRTDGKSSALKGLTSILVHEKCRKRYINKKLISAYVKKSSNILPRQTLRSSIPGFSFKTDCFLCGSKITAECLEAQKRKPISRRNKVYPVRTLASRENILRVAENRGDEWGKSIVERINQVEDLHAADGQYHIKCYKKLYQRPQLKKHKKGRSAHKIDNAMQYIFN